MHANFYLDRFNKDDEPTGLASENINTFEIIKLGFLYQQICKVVLCIECEIRSQSDNITSFFPLPSCGTIGIGTWIVAE